MIFAPGVRPANYRTLRPFTGVSRVTLPPFAFAWPPPPLPPADPVPVVTQFEAQLVGVGVGVGALFGTYSATHGIFFITL